MTVEATKLTAADGPDIFLRQFITSTPHSIHQSLHARHQTFHQPFWCTARATCSYFCYNYFMRRVWKEIARGDKRAQWAGLYVTLNKRGTIVMNRAAHERLGGNEAFLLLYDAANNTIGLKPTAAAIKNAYPAAKYGRHGGRRVNAFRLLAECSLVVDETLEFHDAEIDPDGILVLNLRTARVSNRSINHPSRRLTKEDV